MPIDVGEVLTLVSELCEEKKIKACVTNSLKGGFIAAVCTSIGGILLGPPGLAIGGSIGGITAYSMSDDFRGVPSIILDMTPSQKQELARRIMTIIQDVDYTDGLKFFAYCLSPDIKETIVREAVSFFRNEMAMKVIC